MLRREGLYTSHLSAWRKARRSGSLQGLTAKKRGAKPAEHNPLIPTRSHSSAFAATPARRGSTTTSRAPRAFASFTRCPWASHEPVGLWPHRSTHPA